MTRFLHTADLQLGRKATDSSRRGERQREARLKALRNIADLASAEAVDFLLIAGDLFEDNQVRDLTVQRALEPLASLGDLPVFLLPGNHDLLGPGSVYERPAFRDQLPGNLRVLREPAPVEATADCVLYPCPQLSTYPQDDPLAWIPAREGDERVRVGVVHGSLPGIAEMSEEACPAFNPAAAHAKGLDYTALGHWHGLNIAPDARWAYPGTPEQGTFGERDAGKVLIVDIDGPGARPSIKARHVGVLRWLRWPREVHSAEDLGRLQAEVEALAEGEQTLLRIEVSGDLRADELPRVDDLATWLQARVENGALLSGEVLRRGLHATEQLEGALRELAAADPLVARCVADLRWMADPTAGAAECEGQVASSPDELVNLWAEAGAPQETKMTEAAAEALSMLARLAGEVRER